MLHRTYFPSKGRQKYVFSLGKRMGNLLEIKYILKGFIYLYVAHQMDGMFRKRQPNLVANRQEWRQQSAIIVADVQ